MNLIASRRNGRLRRLLRRRPTVEVHVPISPTPSFLYQLRCLTHSLRLFGGAYRNAPVIATVGASQVDQRMSDRMPWLGDAGIELRWVPEREFAAQGIFATGINRLQHAYQSDMVLLLDADVLIRRPLDELIERSFHDGVMAGVIAHYTPLLDWRREQPSWEDFFAVCGLPVPPLDYEHTGWGYFFSDPRYRYCPAYFNYGVVAAPAPAIAEIGKIVDCHLVRIREAMGTSFDGQLAVAAAVAELGIPTRALPMRYNMANTPLIEALHHREVDDAVILHLLHEHQFRRVESFASLVTLEQLLTRTDLRVTNKMAQEVLRAIYPALVREERRAARAA
jgi:hypothetical protein